MFRTVANRRPDTKVLFGVTYTDGRTAYIRVEKEDAVHNLVIARRAQDQQAKGALPPGTIASVRRVR